MSVFRPCTAPLCRHVCTRPFAPGTGSCSPSFQQLLPTFIPGFTTIYNCTLSAPQALWSDALSYCVSGNYGRTTQQKVNVPRCGVYNGTLCRGVIDYPVYIPAGSTQATMEQTLVATKPLFASAPVDSGCRDGLVKLLCAVGFPR